MRALIVVDVQNDFLPGGALAIPDGDAVVAPINRLMSNASQMISLATQDWHPADHCSFAENHQGKKPGDVVEVNGCEQTLWPVHCVQGTPGAEFAPDLDSHRFAEVFKKGIDPLVDSYSGLFDNERRRATGLAAHLDGLGVDTVFVAGLATDYCVKFTALDVLALGRRTILVSAGCRRVDL